MSVTHFMCALVNSLQISDENLPPSLVQQDGAYWRLSFSLAELNVVRNRLSPVHRELYKALKLLRDIHIREGDTPSRALKSTVFNYVVKENAEATLEKPTEKTAAASAYLPECNLERNLLEKILQLPVLYPRNVICQEMSRIILTKSEVIPQFRIVPPQNLMILKGRVKIPLVKWHAILQVRVL